MSTNTQQRPAFGTVLADHMAIAVYSDGQWGAHEIRASGPIELHPSAHALHYASSCFEGLKSHRWADGSINVFRMDRNIARMRQSARALMLPEPDAGQLAEMIREVCTRNRDAIPEAPGALYLRPLLFGTTPNIGAAATPSKDACLLVLGSPVWDYFAGGMKPLRILVDERMRTAPHLGVVKTGGNYAAALGPTAAARQNYNVDQILFCPGGSVQETGAANFLLIRKDRILTRSLDSTFLHGITRDSLLALARSLDFKVEERVFDIAEMLDWVKDGEAALCGTAAVLTGVGTLVYQDREYRVGDGEVGATTRRLRSALVAIQEGKAAAPDGWLTRV